MTVDDKKWLKDLLIRTSIVSVVLFVAFSFVFIWISNASYADMQLSCNDGKTTAIKMRSEGAIFQAPLYVHVCPTEWEEQKLVIFTVINFSKNGRVAESFVEGTPYLRGTAQLVDEQRGTDFMVFAIAKESLTDELTVVALTEKGAVYKATLTKEDIYSSQN